MVDTVYVGNQLTSNQSVAERKTWNLTTSQSVFPIRYDTGDVDVYKNGLKLKPGFDYTVNLVTRDSITLASPGVNGDFIEIVGWNGYSVTEPAKYIRSKFIYTAVAPLTTYNCGYLMNQSEVFVNGVKLILNDDYTAIDGTSVTLTLPLQIGDTIEVDVYESTSVVDINAKLGLNQSYTRTDFIATAGQTTFTVNYTPGTVQVYQNGVLLQPSDYTATNTTSIVLGIGAAVNDEISVVAWSTFSIADTIKKSGDTMTGNLTLAGNATNPLHAVPKQQLDSAIAAVPVYPSTFYVTANNTANALTFTLKAGNVVKGGITNNPTQVTLATDKSITIPTTSSLGTPTGTSTRLLFLYSFDNSSLCVVNTSGGLNIDESGNTGVTVIGASSLANNVVYSASGILTTSYKIVGWADATWTSGSGWSPLTNYGGANASSYALQSLGGFGTGSYSANLYAAGRSYGTTYYNTSGKVKWVVLVTSQLASITLTGVVNGTTVVTAATSTYAVTFPVYMLVPPGGSYSFSVAGGTPTNNFWYEI